MALVNLSITVNLSPGSFTALAQHLSAEGPTMAEALDSLIDKLVAEHAALQNMPNDWLTDEAQDFRSAVIE